MADLQIGDYVTAIYKTGKYIGEITDIRPMHYLVRVLAVQKHPTQGDLHNPKETEGVFFHERRALAFREQTNVPKQMVKPYESEIPEYSLSLRQSLEKMKDELSTVSTPWAEKCLETLASLERDYFK